MTAPASAGPWLAPAPFVRVDAARDGVPVVDISVVMATYNGQKYLRAALGCISRQTVRPTEVIVIDDGSSDESAEIAEQAGARVIRLSRSGVCAARNRGILEASSSWIAFLDQDDLWLPNKLERQWAALQQHRDAVMVATDATKVDGESQLILESFVHADFMRYEQTQPTARKNGIDYFRDGAQPLLSTGWFLLPSAVLAKRDALIDVGMFDERIVLNEDVSCFIRLLAKGALLVIDEPLTGWRIHSSNAHRDGLAMLKGRLSLSKVAMAEPEAYPAPFVNQLVQQLPGLYGEIGRYELAAGNIPAARAALVQAVRRRIGARTLLLLASTYLGAHNAERLAALYRRVRRHRPNPNG